MTYVYALFLDGLSQQINLNAIISPGAEGEIAGLLVLRPAREVEVAEGGQARRGDPQHGAVRVHDAVRVAVLVHCVPRGAVVLHDVRLPDLVIRHVETLQTSVIGCVPLQLIVVPRLQQTRHIINTTRSLSFTRSCSIVRFVTYQTDPAVECHDRVGIV